MSKLHIKTGDTVVLLTGDAQDRKKTGKVLEVSPKEGKVIVEGLNKVKKHVKPRKAGDPSGIIETGSKENSLFFLPNSRSIVSVKPGSLSISIFTGMVSSANVNETPLSRFIATDNLYGDASVTSNESSAAWM